MAEGGYRKDERNNGVPADGIYFEDSDTEIEPEDEEHGHDTPDHSTGSRPSSTTNSPLPIAHLPPREIKKEGFLFKQGGINHDKGWKKRYMRFDGQTLRYYMNEKTHVSLRIIPVGIMEQANHEERRNSRPTSAIMGGPSRAYKFSLRTRNRTYLFATDNHDNSVQWVCFLTEAILNKSKDNKPDGVKIGGSIGNPDFEGSIKFWKKKRKYHAALKGDIFRYYYNKEDFEIDCPVHELFMQVTNVRQQDNSTRLELRSAPDQSFVLQFDTVTEADQWRMYFVEACSNIGDDTIVSQIKQNKDNGTCADCTSQETNWASINLGVVLCIKCAGVHRSLGVNHSKVRSLRMDSIFKENEKVLLLLTAIGNRNANSFWYAVPEPDREINEFTPDCIRKNHIHQKYVAKEFSDQTPLQSTNLNKDFIEAVRKGDIVNTMRFYESGADIDYRSEDDELDAMTIAEQKGYGVLLEYLKQNRSRKRDLSTSLEKDDIGQKRSSIYHDGYLEKTGPKMRGFLKRWFVLHFCRLTYFDDKKGTCNPKEKGAIDLDLVVCISVTSCDQRLFCFDLTSKADKRIYRFAAVDAEERMMWMDKLLQVICPAGVLDCPICIKQYKIAGFFYVQQHSQGPWVKSWFGIGLQCIDIHYFNEPSQSEEIPLDPGSLKVYKYNASRSSKMLGKDVSPRNLDENKTVELQVDQRAIRIQAHHIDDTEKVFTVLNAILNA